MKSKIVYFLLCCLMPLFLSADQPQPAAKDDKIPYTLHGEHDKTDIYAIPLDSSEEEEDEEEDELEEQEEEQERKKNSRD